MLVESKFDLRLVLNFNHFVTIVFRHFYPLPPKFGGYTKDN